MDDKDLHKNVYAASTVSLKAELWCLIEIFRFVRNLAKFELHMERNHFKDNDNFLLFLEPCRYLRMYVAKVKVKNKFEKRIKNCVQIKKDGINVRLYGFSYNNKKFVN
jgi:hypothetical protein